MRRHDATVERTVDDGDVEHLLGTLRDSLATDEKAYLARRSELDAALRDFRASHASGWLSAGRMITPLLDLWAVASAVDPRVAAPIERLLKALPARAVVDGAELDTCVDEVVAALDDLPS